MGSILSYRCCHRRCKASLKISFADAQKLHLKIEDQDSTKFDIIGEHNNHSVIKTNIANINDIKTEKFNLDLLKN